MVGTVEFCQAWSTGVVPWWFPAGVGRFLPADAVSIDSMADAADKNLSRAMMSNRQHVL